MMSGSDMNPNCSGKSSEPQDSVANMEGEDRGVNPTCCLCNSNLVVLGHHALTAEFLEMLHDSLAHIPIDRIKANIGSGNVIGPEVTPGIYKNSHKHICSICLRAKLTRRSHQGSLPTCERVGRIFGADVYGPMSVMSIRGNKYVFGILEYNSKRAWLYFSNDKNVYYF